MSIVTIIGSGMMGSALAFPARENGHDVRLVGTDDSLWSRTSVPPLATVRIDARHMGSQAVRLLLKRIAAPDAPFAREILAPELVVRASADAARTAPAPRRRT